MIDAGKTDSVQVSLDKMAVAARESHADLRKFIADAMGLSKTTVDLFPMVQEMLRKFEENYGFTTHYTDSRQQIDRQLDQAAQRQILSIVHEALNNVRKHAKAWHVWIKVSDSNDSLRLTIRDDGKGFDLRQVDKSKHFGLQIMKERVAELGAKLQINSRPGQGTQLVVDIPLHFFPPESTVTD